MALGRIYTPDPIAPHWLNDGLGMWFMGIPGLDGGPQFYDLIQRTPGTLQPASGNMWGVGTPLAVDAATGITFPDVNNVVNQDNYVSTVITQQFTDTANFSFEIFVYLPASSGTGQVFVCMNAGLSSGVQFRLGGSNSLAIADGSNGIAITSFTYTTGWNHVVGVVNKGANTSTIYANGVQVASSGGLPPSVTPSPLRLMRNPYPGFPEPAPQGTRVVYFKAWNGPISSTAALALYPEFLSGFPNTLRRESTRSAASFLLAGASATAINQSDTGSGSETVTITVSVLTSDTGTGTESTSSTASFTMTQTGTGADSANVGAAFSVSDTSTGSDSASTVAAVPVTDSAISIEAVSSTVAFTVADTGTSTEVLSPAVAFTVADTGSGVDVVSAISAAISATDSATGVDGQNVSSPGTVNVSDTGVGTESTTITVTFSVIDTATGTEGTPNIAFTATDTGTGTSSTAIAASISQTDSGAGADSAGTGNNTPVNVSDTGTGIESQSIVVAVSAVDTGAGTEATNLNVSISRADSAIGTEAYSINTGVLGTDVLLFFTYYN